MQSTIRVSALSLTLLALFGCASQPIAKKDPRDPWERINRSTYNFNDKVDKGFARPVARTYQRVTPQFVQTGVSNFMDNLQYPIVIVNDLLQGRMKLFAMDTGRLVMNTTIGIGGLLDPASDAGLEKNNNDLGMTLGRWGVKPGPYVVIPFLGPSDVRDGLARIPDSYASPANYIGDWKVHYSLWAVNFLDARARLMSANASLDSAYDPYLFLKNAYLNRRQFLISGEDGNIQPSGEEDQEQKLLDEAGAGDDSATPPQDKSPNGQSPQGQPPNDVAQPQAAPPPPK